MGGPVATARTIKTAGRPLSAVAQAEPPVLLSAPVWLGWRDSSQRRLVSTLERRLPGENVCYQEPWHRRAADQYERDGPGSGNLIVITGTDRTDGTLSRPGQALVQDPVQILVTGPVPLQAPPSCAEPTPERVGGFRATRCGQMRPGVAVIARPVIYAAVWRSSRNCHHARAPSAAALVTCAGLAAVAASALAVQSACSASRSACTSQNATPGPSMP